METRVGILVSIKIKIKIFRFLEFGYLRDKS